MDCLLNKARNLTRRGLLRTLFSGSLAAIFTTRAGAPPTPDVRFRCCANCRHYVPPINLMILDGRPSGYCDRPARKRRYAYYIYDSKTIAAAGLHRDPGDGCDEFFEPNVRKNA
jgi:hypothetical protein